MKLPIQMAPQMLTYAVVFLTLLTAYPAPAMAFHSRTVKGIYYPSWSFNTLPPSSLNTKLFTHIYYAFLSPDPNTFQFNINQQTEAPLLLNFTSTLRHKVKTLYSVGGASEGAALFSRMASTPSSRSSFIKSSIEVARRFRFDGIDLDWEFPQNPTDMQNLGLLWEEWRVEVKKDAAGSRRTPLLLTAAVYYSSDTFLSGTARAYPTASITKNVDWINVMNYDYHGGWDPSATGAHAALFDPTTNLSTSFGLGTWIRVGVPRSKLIMGMPMYGRGWILRDANVDGIGAPAVAVGPSDDGSGAVTYSDILKFNKDNGARVVYDKVTVSMYSVAGTTWIGYDDVPSVTVKVEYAQRLRLRGYFFWAANGDHMWTISTTASQLWF